MKSKQSLYNLIICSILLVYNLIYRFIILNNFRSEEAIITSGVLILLFILSVLMFGFAQAKLNSTKKKAIIVSTAIVIIGVLVTYALGVFVGFLRNGYSQSLKNIFKNTFSPIFIIIFTELFRYNFIRANKNKFKYVVLITALIAILEVQMSIAMNVKWDFLQIYIAVTSIAIPRIAKNMLLSYMAYEIGYQPCLIYRLIFELYIFFVPYLPNFGDYLTSMFGLIVPMLTFSYVSTIIDEHEEGIKQEFIAAKSRVIEIPLYMVILLYIALISRVFPVFMIGIGSGSMTGTINKGDAVIAYKAINPQIEVNDVIVFEIPGKVVIHRVIDIEEIDGIKYYRTKGDANPTKDNFDITMDKIKGKVKVRVPYISIPSVFLSETIQKYIN